MEPKQILKYITFLSICLIAGTLHFGKKDSLNLGNLLLVSPAFSQGSCKPGPAPIADCCTDVACQHVDGSKRCVYDKDCSDKMV